MTSLNVAFDTLIPRNHNPFNILNMQHDNNIINDHTSPTNTTEKVIGFACIYEETDLSIYTGNKNFISIMVMDGYRNKGLGSKLLKIIDEYSPKEELYLWCKTNLTSFYEYHGWKTIHHNIDYNNYKLNIMKKHIHTKLYKDKAPINNWVGNISGSSIGRAIGC